MNKINQYRLFAVLIPLVCLALGSWVVFNQNRRLGELTVEAKKVADNLEFQKRMIAEIGNQPLAEKEPMAPISDAEQANFLEGLRTNASESGVTLLRWSNIAAPAPDPNKPASALPQGVSEVLSNLEVEGPYSSVRSFLYSIARAPRLLNFSGIKWTRVKEGDMTNLKVTVTRYVSPPELAPPASPNSASKQATEPTS